MHLVLQGVYRVYNIVVFPEIELRGSLGAVHLVDGGDLRMGVYVKQPLLQSVHLGHAHGADRRHQLAVDVAHADLVRVDYCQPAYPGTDETFRAPAPDSSDTQNDHFRGREGVERGPAHQQFRTFEYLLFGISAHLNKRFVRQIYLQDWNF